MAGLVRTKCRRHGARRYGRLLSRGRGGAAGLDPDAPSWRRHLAREIVIEGSAALMYDGDGLGSGWRGHYPSSLGAFWAGSRRDRANEIPDHVKRHLLWARYMRQSYDGRYYARAQNLARSLTAAYERAFEDVDIIAMPTIPVKPPRLPHGPLGLLDTLELAGNMSNNTSPLDLTGHPAISIPCGTVDGLPVGLGLRGPPLGRGHAAEGGEGVRAPHAGSPAGQPHHRDLMWT